MSRRFARMTALQTARAFVHWARDLPEPERQGAALSYGLAMAVLYAVFKRGGGRGGGSRNGQAPSPESPGSGSAPIQWGAARMVRTGEGLRAHTCGQIHDPRKAWKAISELGDPEAVLDWALERVQNIARQRPGVLEDDNLFYRYVYLPVRDE